MLTNTDPRCASNFVCLGSSHEWSQDGEKISADKKVGFWIIILVAGCRREQWRIVSLLNPLNWWWELRFSLAELSLIFLKLADNLSCSYGSWDLDFKIKTQIFGRNWRVRKVQYYTQFFISLITVKNWRAMWHRRMNL